MNTQSVENTSDDEVVAQESARPGGRGPILPSRRSFYIIAIATMVLLMGSTLPTPLYGIYEKEFGLSSLSITFAYAAYAIAIVPGLFIFGPWGDMRGRKESLLIAIISAIIGTAILGNAQGLAWLIVGRFIYGIGIAASLGNATAALVESEPNGNERRASQAAGVALFGGLALGPLIAGLLVEYLSEATLPIYLAELVLLIVVLAFLLTTREMNDHQEIERFRMRKPVMPAAKGIFWSSSMAAALVFAMDSLYFSVVPIYEQSTLHISSVAFGGAIVSLMVFSSVISEVALWDQGSTRLEIAGLICLVFGLALIVLARIGSSLIFLVLSSILNGIGGGAAFLGAVSTINKISPSKTRGNVTSTFYAIAYLALGVPIIGLGLASLYADLFSAVEYFVAMLILMAVLNLIWILLQRR